MQRPLFMIQHLPWVQFFNYKKKIGELLCMKIRIESTFFQIRFCTSEKEVFNGTTSFALLSWPYSSYKAGCTSLTST